MFLAAVKTVFVEALKQTFSDTYPKREFRNLTISLDYPVERAHYPSIWVNFSPVGQVKQAGVGHMEMTQTSGDNGDRAFYKRHTRFLFEGVVTFTCVALSGLEKDRLFDQVQRVIQAGPESPLTSQFRAELESSEFIIVTPTYSNLDVSGDAASPGTPWGNEDEMIYEISLSAHCFGEFYIDPDSYELVNLKEIKVIPEVDPSMDSLGGYPNPPRNLL